MFSILRRLRCIYICLNGRLFSTSDVLVAQLEAILKINKSTEHMKWLLVGIVNIHKELVLKANLTPKSIPQRDLFCIFNN